MLNADITSKARRKKNIIDLVVCELCSISIALIINCIVFFNYFKAIALPIIFISVLAAVSIGAIIFRDYYLRENGLKEETYFWYHLGKKLKAFGKKVKFDQWKGWIYLSPAIVLLLIFTVWPIFNTVRMSLLEGYTTMKEVNGAVFNFGIGNFARVLAYPGFITCLKNTILLTVLTVPISTFLALLIAVCLNSIKLFSRALQTIFFLPYVTNSIAIGMVFAAMFKMIIGGSARPDTVGIVNNVIEFFCGEGSYINWMNAGSEYWANIVVMVVYIVWNALPFKILILLGGLQSVNKQYYDAAKVDGTSRVRVFTKITVPLLSPMIAYVVITGFIGGFKEYSSIVGVFGEGMGPVGNNYALDTMVGFIYRAIGVQEGTASAAALILFAIIFVVTMINLYVSNKKTHY